MQPSLEKPYGCRDCGRYYKSQQSLGSHRYINHPLTAKKPKQRDAKLKAEPIQSMIAQEKLLQVINSTTNKTPEVIELTEEFEFNEDDNAYWREFCEEKY